MKPYEKPSLQECLAHHGIKGMKWGVRRFQNEDGSLTPAGQKRYNDDVEGAKQKVADAKAKEKEALRAYNKATLGGTVYNEKAQRQLETAGLRTQLAKKDLSSEKVKAAMNKETGEKSKHRLKLEQEYQKKGLTQEEAEVAAYQRVRTEKILAVAAGVTVAAISGYAAYKYHDKTVDKLIQSGTLLQNISKNDTMGVRDAFYSSMTELDNQKYRGVYGQAIRSTGNKVFEKKIGVTSALKVASERHATEALSDLVKNDSSYAQTLRDHLEKSVGRYSSPSQEGVIKRGLNSLKKGKIDAKVYEALNLSLVDHSLSTSDAVNKGFYNKLKSLGYDAIIDVNDKKYSGYRSARPLITFNTAKTTVQSVREVGDSEIAKAAVKGYLDISVKSLAPQVVGGVGAYGLATTGMKALKTRSDNEIVRKYRAEHPNSELSYTDILRNEKGIR